MKETIKNLIWKGREIPEYTISNTGIVYHKGRSLLSWMINGRNYASIKVDNKYWQYRIDYMVAYTFLGMYSDAIRLIHLDDNIANDHVLNLKWYRKCDVIQEYIEFAILEEDGSLCEEWRPCITEYNPTLNYEVSNLGCIRDQNHEYVRIKSSHGYRVFYYLDITNKTTRVKAVHRAVAEAFIPNPNNYELVNHLNGDKEDDVVYNLEWASSGMNMEHAYIQNLNSKVRYNEYQIHDVCELLSRKRIPHVQISYMTGVDRKTISDIYRGRRWKEVSSQYNFQDRKWTPELKNQISNMIIHGMKGKEIFDRLNIEYNQSAISYYERIRRFLKSQHKIA